MSRDEAQKNFWMTIVSSTLFIIFGVYLLYKPNATIAIISRTLTVITLLIGIIGLYKYLIRKDKSKKIDINIVYSIISFIIAILAYLNPFAISLLIPIVLGGYTITNTLLKIGYLKHLGKTEKKDLGVCIFIFIIMMLMSILLLLNPFKTIMNSNQSLAILIVFYSVLDMILCYLFKNNVD